jgi:hypothetical protein
VVRGDLAPTILSEYTLVIIITLVGFIGLAALLLVPVYRFLKREERLGNSWTKDASAEKRGTQKASRNGTGSEPP